MAIKSVVLHSTEGGSDKLYSVSITASGDGYHVGYSNGRRGGTMATGLKTKTPVSLEAAEKLFDKVVKEKLGKHYRPIEGDAPVFVGQVGGARVDSGFRPQLSNAIDAAEARKLCRDPNWFAQVKHNGERCSLRVINSKVEGINRKGFITPLPIEIPTVINALPLGPRETLIDGEQMGVHFAAFDLLVENGRDLRDLPADVRYGQLCALLGDRPSPIIRTPTAFTTEAKFALLAKCEAEGEEGLVFKRCTSIYASGKPASGGDSLKYKFYETVSCRVRDGGRDCRSVPLELCDPSGAWHPVGNVTIPPNQSVPRAGAICEVRYLYFVSSLYQPTYLGVRNDLDHSDCTMQQLKYKGEGRAAA